MNTVKTLMLLVLLTTCGAQAQSRLGSNRAEQVREFFLKEANKKGSAINRALLYHKEDLETGFCADDCVLPKILTKENIQMIKTGSETYIGTYRGDEESDEGSTSGYERASFDIIVLLNAIHYGGRIDSETALRFTCDLSTKSFNSSEVPDIECQVLDSQNTIGNNKAGE